MSRSRPMLLALALATTAPSVLSCTSFPNAPASGAPSGSPPEGGAPPQAGPPPAGLVGNVGIYQPCQCDQWDLYYTELTHGTCTQDTTCSGPPLPTSTPPLRCASGACTTDCYSDADCPGGVCASSSNGPPGTCLLPCTLLPDSCPFGLACSVLMDEVTSSLRVLTVCRPKALTTPGMSCEPEPELGLELTQCEPWCRLGQNDCAPGTSCIDPFIPVFSSGGFDYGVCRSECDPTKACPDGRDCIMASSRSGTEYTDCVPQSAQAGLQTCMQDTDCAPGLACVPHPLAGSGSTCEQVCALPDGACPAGASCAAPAKPRIVRGVSYGTCAADCDPLSKTSCAVDSGCVIEGMHTDCAPAGTGVGASSPCPCVAGAQCTEVPVGPSWNHMFACEAYCRPDQPASCPSGFNCMYQVPATKIGGIDYGVCQDVCDLAKPADICGANATCLLVQDGVNPPHTACVALFGPGCVETQVGVDGDGNPIDECVPLPAPTLGVACTDDSTCPAGATCQGDTCVAWCAIGGNTHCPGGTICQAITPTVSVNGVDYGVCKP